MRRRGGGGGGGGRREEEGERVRCGFIKSRMKVVNFIKNIFR